MEHRSYSLDWLCCKTTTSKEIETEFVTVKTSTLGPCLFTRRGVMSDNPLLTWWCCSLLTVTEWLLTPVGLKVSEKPARCFCPQAVRIVKCLFSLFICFSVKIITAEHGFNAVTPEILDYRVTEMTLCLLKKTEHECCISDVSDT